MDAVELPYPVDVAVVAPLCKLMGSDGFGRAAVGASVKEAEHRDFDSAVTLPSPSIGRFSSPNFDKDVSSTVNASNSLVEDKSTATGCSRHDDLLPKFKNEDLFLKPLTGYTKLSPLTGGEECQLQFKTGRDSRSNGKCSKRVRIAREEDSSSSRITGAHELGDISDKSAIKSPSLERSQSGKQRNTGSKRGDKRNFKVPLKIKNDYLRGWPSISSLSTAGSAAPGGFYGLKSDVHEVTKLVNDLSLREILEGSYECPTLGKERGKKAVNANEPIMQSVRKVCSMRQTVKSSKSLNISDLDISGDKKVCSPFLSSASLGGSGIDADCGDPSSVELASSNEDSYTKSEVIPVHPLDKPLYSPLDLFKRLALPPTKDLDSLLLDATKPISSSKSASDLRLGKQQLAHRGGLPHFPWSNALNGHSRTNSDAAKLHTVRATCPGKWARMKNPVALFRGNSDGFTDLDSITYDQCLVPCGKVEVVVLEFKSGAHESPSVPSSELGLSSSAACVFASRAPLELREETDDLRQANQFSSVIAAAQTLCEMAASSPKKASGNTKWPKKQPLQKALKTRKLNLGNNEAKELVTSPSRPNGPLVHPDKIWPSKKPKLSTMERCFAKAPINWAAPRSSRSSPSRLVRESMSETKLSILNITKPRKPVLPDWSKGKEGLQ